jgi:hypothetical protein
MVGFRDGIGAGLDIRVAAIPAVTVVIGLGDGDLTVDYARRRRERVRSGRWAFVDVVAFPR